MSENHFELTLEELTDRLTGLWDILVKGQFITDHFKLLILIALFVLVMKFFEYRWHRNGAWHVYSHPEKIMRRWNGGWEYRPMTAEERATIKDYYSP